MSECKGLTKDQCLPPKCTYVNSALKYCRTAKNKRRALAQKTAPAPLAQKTAPAPLAQKTAPTRKSPASAEKQHARTRIAKFIKKSTKFLNMVCADSGQCLAFGNKIHDIMVHFNGFTNFTYVVGELEELGNESINGFVRKIKYERNGYQAYSILKSSKDELSDNLVYEYVVGIKFINRILQQTPCFMYTYGLYYYKSLMEYLVVQDYINGVSGKAILDTTIDLQKTIDYKQACEKSKYACVLIQYLDQAESFSDALSSDGTGNYIQYHLVYTLFILYHTLARFATTFTHYDLHGGNVLIFRPFQQKTLEYVYHLSNGSTVMFRTPFVPKIIDYGRCFFDNGNVSSKTVYDKICSVPECAHCGSNSGFTLLSPTPWNGITGQKKNESHDLRLVFNLAMNIGFLLRRMKAKASATYTKLDRVLTKVKYGVGQAADEVRFGTVEDTHRHPKGNVIANVMDMYTALRKIVTDPVVIQENKDYVVEEVAGQFHIYEDGRPMKFEPA